VAGVNGRRLLLLAATLVAIGVPAAALHVACVGRSCDARSVAAGRVPFCTLPERARTLLANGYREGRSPDVLAVAAAPGVSTDVPTEGSTVSAPWPTTGNDVRVPVVFWGTGV
jgi:hypothetical protein